jgi:hypothetical protein
MTRSNYTRMGLGVKWGRGRRQANSNNGGQHGFMPTALKHSTERLSVNLSFCAGPRPAKVSLPALLFRTLKLE